jgi:phosphatidate cytidylyltransferase
LELLKRVLTAAVLIPIVLLLVLRAPVPVLAFVAGVVALLAIHELLKLAEGYNIRPLYKPTYVFVALFFLLIAISPEASSTPALSTSGFAFVAVCFAGFAPFIFLAVAMRREELSSAFPAAMLAAFAFAYIGLPMASLVQLREQWQGSFFLLYLLLLVWAGDIFAYFIGKSLGTHRMSPRVSPKKTWEGAVASVVASVAVGMLMTHYAVPISRALLHARLIEQRDGVFTEPALFPIIILSIVLNVAAQLGDLVESVIKRGAGAKDSGAILPGHGGMFDRIDALLFAAPVLWAYMAWRVLLQ